MYLALARAQASCDGRTVPIPVRKSNYPRTRYSRLLMLGNLSLMTRWDRETDKAEDDSERTVRGDDVRTARSRRV